MRHITALLILIFSTSIFAQNNVVKTAGVSYTAGAPTFTPGRTGSQVAIDTVTGFWYEHNGTSWSASGYRVQTISGCSAPAYTPAKYQSRLVINACSAGQGGPELYYYTGSAWLQINEGQTYTAGTGIDITAGVISNTAPGHTLKGGGTSMTARTGANFVSTSTVSAALTDDGAGDETEIRMSIPTDAITAVEIAADAVGSSEIAADAVGSSEIATDAVGSAEIAANAVGTSELASTAVTAGTYTNATVTFDADGRATSASSGTAPATGTGTTNYVPKWTSSSTLGNSQFYDNGTNIGIGTTTPKGKFTIAGPGGDNILLGKSEILFLGGGIANNGIRNNYGGVKGVWVGNTDCCDTLGAAFSAFLKIGGTNESEFFQKLKVPTFQMTTGAAVGRVLQSDASGNATWQDQWKSGGSVVGLWTDVTRVTVGGTTGSRLTVRNNDSGTTQADNNEYEALVLRPQVATTNNWSVISGQSQSGAIAADIGFQFTSHTTHNADIVFTTRAITGGSYAARMRVTSDGNVGIGTGTPSQKLHVSGNARLSGAFYDGTNSAGSSGNILSSTGSTTQWKNSASVLSGSTYVPTGTADALGTTGDFSYDSNYIYVKTPAGWKRATLSTF